MQIRPATVSDACPTTQIHVASWQTAYRGQMPDAVLDNLDVAKRATFWQNHLSSQSLETFVAESDQVIIGFCDLIPSRDQETNPQTTAEIAANYIHPDFCRRGAGRALCLRALDAARHRRFTAVTLWVLSSNRAAQFFYRAMGFLPDGATKSESFANQQLQERRFRISI